MLTVAPEASALGDHLIERLTLHERMPPGLVRRPGGMPGRCLLILFYDAVELGWGDGVIQAPAGSLMFWPEDSPHHLGHKHQAWDHSWCICAGSVVRALCHGSGLPPLQPLALQDPAAADRLLHELYYELRQAQPEPPSIRGLLDAWLRRCRRDVRREGGLAEGEARLWAARRYAEDHLAKPLRLEDLAAVAGWSASHFSAAFKASYGEAPYTWLTRRRLDYACYLLRDHSLGVAEVAQRCGFSDAFHFSRLFKQHFAHSPRAWRQRSAQA